MKFGQKMKFVRLQSLFPALVAALGFSITVPAQVQLPALPVDSHITKGTLNCGVTYYMVKNPQEKGYANLAIVQRDEPLSFAKQERLNTAFIGRMGLAPGTEGYLEDADGSTIYRFNHIPVYRQEVLDSTLLYTFAQVAASRAEQAVIVSGDIDPTALKSKMDIFSMMVSRMLVRENHHPDYVWEPSPAPIVRFHPQADPEITVTYAGARVPYAYMNTSQATVTQLFGNEMGVLLRHRLERNLRDADIPYRDIRFHAVGSADDGGDERYSVSVRVQEAQLDDAMRVISSTLAEMDAFGATPREFMEAKQVLQPHVRRKADNLPSNDTYTDRCIANFLYGASLAPDSETLRYFARKTLPDSTETRLFNNFSSALLEQLVNLTLEFSGIPNTLEAADEALFYYNLSYLYGSLSPSGKDYSWHGADTAGLNVRCPKVRIKSEKPEAVTGGTLWTFSNGMRVIFKPVKGSGMFSYALQLNGGLAQAGDLQEGEGGYFGDILSLYDVGGIPAYAFRDLLDANGIDLSAHVGLNGMSIYGDAPSDKFTLLLKMLLNITGNHAFNEAEYRRFIRNRQVGGSSIDEELHSRLDPGYAYTTVRHADALTDETWRKADTYFTDRFCHMQDGILIISGDLSEEAVKRHLTRYLGGFRTIKSTAAVRRSVPMQTVSGVTTYTGTDDPRGIYMLVDAEYPLSSGNFYTAQVAAEALRRSLVTQLVGYGFASEVSVEYLFHPQERLRMRITCRPLRQDGVPADVGEVSTERALMAVRMALRNASLTPVDPVDLQAWKARLLQQVNSLMATPAGFTSTLLARYAANKDFASYYTESINAISAADVQALLGALSAGGRIEYIVP